MARYPRITWKGPKGDPNDIVDFIKEHASGDLKDGDLAMVMDPADFSISITIKLDGTYRYHINTGEFLMYHPSSGMFGSGIDYESDSEAWGK